MRAMVCFFYAIHVSILKGFDCTIFQWKPRKEVPFLSKMVYKRVSG